jgi:hypothetical protein
MFLKHDSVSGERKRSKENETTTESREKRGSPAVG